MNDKDVYYQAIRSSANFIPCHVGILAPFKVEEKKPIGRQTNLMEDFFRSANALCVSIAVFNPFDLVNASAMGYPGRYHDGSEWVKGWMSEPRVIYDRYYSNINGFDHGVEQAKVQIESNFGCPFINSIQLSHAVTDKAVFERLMNQHAIPTPPVLRSGLNASDELQHLLSDYASIVLKPRFGRMGRGIIRIGRIDRKYRILHFRDHYFCSTIGEVFGVIQGIARQNQLCPQDYLIQEEIQAKWMDRFYDIRYLLQRINQVDPPLISGRVVRISASELAIPNLDQGGLALDLPFFLKRLQKAVDPDQLTTRLDELALSTFQVLENQFGFIGELGLDMLIDQNCQIHLIEVNSKPGRIAFHRLSQGFGLPDTLRKQYQQMRLNTIMNPIKYGFWLSQLTNV